MQRNLIAARRERYRASGGFNVGIPLDSMSGGADDAVQHPASGGYFLLGLGLLMSRSLVADKILEAFLDILREMGVSVRDMNDLARDFDDPELRNLMHSLGQAGRHVFRVGGVGFVNIHISTSDKGFWGVQQSVKNDFDALAKFGSVPCFYIFLVSRKDSFIANGYIASDLISPPFVRPMSPKANGFRINQKTDFDPSKELLSIRKVARELVEKYGTQP